jgi:hypothetical protein
MAAVLGAISTEVKIYVRPSIDLDQEELHNEYHWETVIQTVCEHFSNTAPKVMTDVKFYKVKTDMNHSPRENCARLMEAAQHTTRARNGQRSLDDFVMMTMKERYKGTTLCDDLVKSNRCVSLEEMLRSMDGQYQVLQNRKTQSSPWSVNTTTNNEAAKSLVARTPGGKSGRRSGRGQGLD